MRRIILYSFFFSCFFVLALTGCGEKQTGCVVSDNKEKNTDNTAPYVEGNKKILQWECEEMALFVKRYGWKMTQTGTGLYVEFLNHGTGRNFQEGDRLVLSYKTFLLSGEMVYDSDSTGDKSFTVGRSEEISGLHEVALLLKPGAEARLVLPSHLAYGVSGDGNKIQGRMPIAMIIKVEN